jgi:Skp family chaperone for outer membrane proteins
VMKKLRSLVGLAAAALIVCSTANAQQNGQANQQYQPPPMPKTKIAMLNLQHVVKNYEKWKLFEEEYKSKYKGYDAEFEKIKKEGLALKEQLTKLPQDGKEAESIKTRLKVLDRSVQDLGDSAKAQLLKLQDDMSIHIYTEVEAAVGAYAKANDIDLVMQFNDGVLPTDKSNPQNIQRKMQTGALMPMYSVDGMDISPTIIIMLNDHYRRSLSQASGAPAGQR